MFIDSLSLEDERRIESEVCVIGGGVAGITLALEFEKQGIETCLLESGGFKSAEDNRDLYRGDNVGLPYYFADGCRSRYLGGSSNCWGGWCRPLEEDDFDRREWIPYSGWPFQRSELEPYYERSHPILQLGPVSFDAGFWTDAIGRRDVARHPYVGTDVVDVVSQFSPPTRFGEVYRSALAEARHVRVFLNANVVDILTDGGDAVRRLRLKMMNGRSANVHASVFVLATGGIENARLLLLANKERPQGLGNQNDLVGRFFMDHPCLTTAVVRFRGEWSRNLFYDSKFHYRNKAVAAHGACIAGHMSLSQETRRREGLLHSNITFLPVFPGEYTGVKDALVRLKRRLEGVTETRRSLIRELFTLAAQPLNTAGFIAARYLQAGSLQARSLIDHTRLQVICEPAPDPESRVTLSQSRDRLGQNRVTVDWRLGDQTKRTVDRTIALIAAELDRSGVAEVTLDPPVTEQGWPESFSREGCWHHIGTTRMHNSPRFGVVDRDCRVHGTANLYVAGSSVFPTAGGDFPTTTIVALALRLADHVASVLNKRPSYRVRRQGGERSDRNPLVNPLATGALGKQGAASMVQPRQIVYPMHYLTPWLQGSEKAEELFVAQNSNRLGGAYVVPLGRARTGLYLLVKSALTGSRRRVVMSPLTIADVVNMVRFAGGEPVFVDCLPNSTNVDLDHLRSLLDDSVACVLLTHYSVSQNKTREIVALCHERGAKLFEDCAVGLGATIGGQPVGTFGDAGVFSLSGFKIQNFIWGGFIVTKDRQLFEALSSEVSSWPRLRPRQYFGMAKAMLRYAFLTSPLVFPLAFRVRSLRVQQGKIEDLIPRVLIETPTLDETIETRPALAAFAEWNRKFDDAPAINKHRRAIAAIYDRAFRSICVAPETDEEVRASSAFGSYPIVVGEANRARVYSEVLRRGFDIGLTLYPNVHELPANAPIPGRSSNIFALVRSLLSLPTHTGVSEAYASKLADCVVEVMAACYARGGVKTPSLQEPVELYRRS
jgi:dTDP-4-amino-4,6-dideoxygalactose transaminase/choline dehydrogenase-like flavoprotein